MASKEAQTEAQGGGGVVAEGQSQQQFSKWDAGNLKKHTQHHHKHFYLENTKIHFIFGI